MLFISMSAVFNALSLLQGERIMVLVHLSVQTRMESYPFEVGRSVIKSMVIISNGRSGISVGWSGSVVGCVLFFVSWHVAQPSTKFLTNMDIPGHQKFL